MTRQRIDSLDSVRGLAILGILLLNISGFALPSAAYLNPGYNGSASATDLIIWSVLSIFAQGKFLCIFAFLFGATLELLLPRGKVWNYPRLIILALIGGIHGILFWDGDILLSYSLAGFFSFHLISQNSTSSRLFMQGAVFYLIGLVLLFILGFFSRGESNDAWRPTEFHMLYETFWKTGGGWLAVEERFNQVMLMMVMLFVQYGWQLIGIMLCGAGLVRNGWLKGEFPVSYYRNVALLLIPLSVAVQIFSVALQYAHDWDYFWSGIVGYILSELVIPFQALGYMALIYGFWPVIAYWRINRWFRQVGRMAMSNYLLQTLICTVLFYHFGLFGQFSRLELLAFIPFIWTVNVLFSCWWLRRHRQGPSEWLWRNLTAVLARSS
ncbi:hypothetical protein BB987_09760 [Photorhabdus temperata]|uniref:DUF418 domain-containing protein n=2 Tax=Photorhabdus khanii TaxID=1004150 RepID=A0A7C9LBG6_9GAMM|nr:DUF418 domain-containing protein YeiB [Photorhabdus khanii]ETS29406.1 putative membrane protein [Photorhabdus khanii NC19]MQL48408.1 DUF418 domain-containing protein [Photorhabdus khanii]OHV54705.1 hypothetical protein BB987_09760 [Photorhabdus temperata]